jgi:hypothetical protein
MFRAVSPSVIRSLRLYIQHQVCVIQVLWLLASGKEMERRYILFPNLFVTIYVKTPINIKMYNSRYGLSGGLQKSRQQNLRAAFG